MHLLTSLLQVRPNYRRLLLRHSHNRRTYLPPFLDRHSWPRRIPIIMGTTEPTLGRLPPCLRHHIRLLASTTTILHGHDRHRVRSTKGRSRSTETSRQRRQSPSSTHQACRGQQMRFEEFAAGQLERRTGLGTFERVWFHGDERTRDGQHRRDICVDCTPSRPSPETDRAGWPGTVEPS